jgi:hypothetical protein
MVTDTAMNHIEVDIISGCRALHASLIDSHEVARAGIPLGK